MKMLKEPIVWSEKFIEKFGNTLFPALAEKRRKLKRFWRIYSGEGRDGNNIVFGTGGHCYIVYTRYYDAVDVVLDWCYYFTPLIIKLRKWFGLEESYLELWGQAWVDD